MARKKTKSKKKPSSQQSPEQLLARYRNLAVRGNWQEALKVAKELVKREGPLQEPLIIEAYVMRAEALEAKGLLQEAQAMLQNAFDKYDDEGIENACIRLWFRTANWAKLTAFYAACFKKEDREKTAKLDPWLAASLLGGVADLEDQLPEACPPRQHLAAAREAMIAFCEGRDQDFPALIKNIPFRSPYRDFGLILKGLAGAASDPSHFDACMNRVSPNSAFRPLAETLAKARREKELELKTLSSAEASLILNQWGLSGLAVNTYQKLSGLSAKKAAAYLAKHGVAESGLPESLVRAFLTDHLPHNPSLFQKFSEHFKVRPYERYRFEALALKLEDDDLCALEDTFLSYMEQLQKDRSVSDRDLRCGLIHYWLGEHFVEDDLVEYDSLEDWESLAHWKKSIAFDPKNPETYAAFLFALTHGVEIEDAARERRDLLKLALKNLPDHPAILSAVVEDALARKSYKRAIRYGKMLLQKDAVNTYLRQQLVMAQLSLAESLSKQKKWSEAAREVDEACEFARKGSGKELIPLYRARIALGQKQPEEGSNLIHQGWQDCSTVESQLHFVQTSRGIGFTDQATKKQLKRFYVDLQNMEPTEAHLRQFLEFVKNHPQEKNPSFISAFTKFLKASAKPPIASKTLEKACQDLLNAGLANLVGCVAREAHTHYKKPHFTYYIMLAKMDKQPDKGLSDRDMKQLRKALDQATAENDQKMMESIEKLLLQVQIMDKIQRGMPDDFDPFNNPDDEEAFLDHLMDMFGDLDVD